MNVPGSNLLSSALTLVCPEPFQLYRFTGVTTNAIGYNVRSYDVPIDVNGSIQAVERQFYSELGLDFNRRYISIWSVTDIEDLYRGRAGDQIGWDTRRWEVVGETEWFQIDGWNTALAIEVPDP